MEGVLLVSTELKLPKRLHDYEHKIWSTSRWEGFKPRPDDIFVCTSYKAGTTWAQMICALLVFQTPKFDELLTRMSPWLELNGDPIEEILALYAAQEHRRFIKTHTPLDGLPFYPDVTYLYVGRDPRDVWVSMQNMNSNFKPGDENPEEAEAKKASAEEAGEKDESEPMPEDPNERFRLWLTKGGFEWEEDGFPYWSHLAHAKSFWEYRHLPNVHLFHYADMKANLDREMRRFAKALNIDVNEAVWASLVEAAMFESMKKNADRLAPEVDRGNWLDNAAFFKTGTSGQWRDVLDEESLALYGKVIAERLPPDLAAWLEEGSASGVQVG